MGLTLHIAEGEKCADALCEVGLIASTSQGGSGRAAETDWSPAARFQRVYIWQDVDEDNPKTGINPGEKYAQSVADLILKAAAASDLQPEIFIVDLRAYWIACKLAVVKSQNSESDLTAVDETGKEFNDRDVFDLIADLRADGAEPQAVAAGLVAIAEQYGRYWGVTLQLDYPNQPKPPGPAPVGDQERVEIFNWHWVKRAKKDGDEGNFQDACLLDQVRDQALKATKGWPCRLHAPGAIEPILFVDNGNGKARYITKCAGFEQFLHERGRLSFLPGMDLQYHNFVSTMSLYQDFGSSDYAKEFKAIEYYPHEPLMDGHYYTWRQPEGYRPDGRRFAQFLKFFPNVATPEQRMLFAAMAATPFWGGPYKERPAFILEAPDRNCGKTTLAQKVAGLVGGYFTMSLDKKAEQDFYKRILSIGAGDKRVVIIDNVKKIIDSEMLEKWITEEWISGHMLHHGERQRPNNLSYIVTANGARASKDIVTRIFGVPLTKPDKNPDWSRELNKFMARYTNEVAMDILQMLRGPKQIERFKPAGDERFTLWIDEVLNRVCGSRAVADVVGAVDVRHVLEVNQIFRGEHDEDAKQAQAFWEALLPLVAKDRGFLVDANSMSPLNYAQGETPLAIQNLTKYWLTIFEREVNPTWLGEKLTVHLNGERFPFYGEGKDRKPGLRKGRNGLGQMTYFISAKAMNAFLHSREDAKKRLDEERRAAEAVVVEVGNGAI